MKLKTGQQVIIKKNLGEKNGKGRDRYYYGESLREVSLGSRGVVVELHNSYYKIKANGVEVCLVEEEFAIDEDYEKEQRKEYESLLEGVLADEEPVEKKSRGERKFEPKFNAKDEFVVWVRGEFPELKGYAEKKEEYPDLCRRISEVKTAMSEAWEGVKITTNYNRTKNERDKYCHRNYLMPYFRRFDNSGPEQYAAALETLVQALELSGTAKFPYNRASGEFHMKK